jgi:ketosteroid isomerase-like protein
VLADDAEWWVAGPPERLSFAGLFRGPAGFDRWRVALHAAVKYDRFALLQEIVADDEVVQIIDASGHALATGRAYASQVVRIFTVRGGRVARARSYYDTAAYIAALGV